MINLKKVGIISLCSLLLAGCGKVSKLSNGDDAVVSFKDDKKISVNDLYKNMKSDFALESLITMIDTYILETEFKEQMADAEEYAKNYIKSMQESYGSRDELLKALQQYGYSTISAYQKNIYLGQLQDAAVNAYSKIIVTDKDIEKYYKDKAKGDVEVSHILITAKTTEGMSQDEKTAAEDSAKKKVEDLIKEINSAEDKVETFKKLAKENSEDESNKNDGGSLGKITYGDLAKTYDELLNAAYSIKDGEVYSKVVTTELGYHVVMKTKSYEKDTLDKLKDEIREILAKDLAENTKDISLKAMEYYRDKYKLNIEDSELKDQYEDYLTRLKASYATDNTNTNTNTK